MTLVSQDRSSKMPTAQQWNVNVQHELPGAVLLDVGYNGNWLYNDWRSIDGNPAPPGPGDINARRRFTTAIVPGTTDADYAGQRRAHPERRLAALQRPADQVEKRYAGGVSLLGAYTWSKTLGLSYPPGGANNVYQHRSISWRACRRRKRSPPSLRGQRHLRVAVRTRRFRRVAAASASRAVSEDGA